MNHSFNITLAAFMTVTPALAQDTTVLAELTEQLTDSIPSVAATGALAACLGNPIDLDAVVSVFRNAGWTVLDRHAFIEINNNNIWVMLTGEDNGFSCDISSDLDSSQAALVVSGLISQTNWEGWKYTVSGSGCPIFDHSDGYFIPIASSEFGSKCSPTEHSIISVYPFGW